MRASQDHHGMAAARCGLALLAAALAAPAAAASLTAGSGEDLAGAIATVNGGADPANEILIAIPGSPPPTAPLPPVGLPGRSLTLSGLNTYPAALALGAGTVLAVGGQAIGDLSAVSLAPGATLRILGAETVGSLAGGGLLEIGGGSRLTVGADGTSTLFSGPITGAGALGKFGTGRLTLAGPGTYSGGTVIDGGATSGGALVVANPAALGTGPVTLQAFGTLRAGVPDLVLPNPVVVAAAGIIEPGGQALRLGPLRGEGLLAVEGPGTLAMTADGFAGSITALGSRLVLDGAAPRAELRAIGFGSVGGTVTLGGLSIGLRGRVEPTGPADTITVLGNVRFDGASALGVLAAPGGQSSRIQATGVASFAGSTLLSIGATRPVTEYAPRTTYAVLTAAGGVFGRIDGSFAAGRTGGVAVAGEFLPLLTYAPDALLVTLVRQDAAFADIAVTPNQRAVAAAITALGLETPLGLALLARPDAAARRELDALSGELHASTATLLLDEARLVRGTLLGRLRPGTAPAADGPARLGAWIQGFGDTLALGGNRNAATARRGTAGLLAGLDLAGAGGWRIGLAAGHAGSSIRVRDPGAGQAEVETTHLAAYAGYRAGPLRAAAGLAMALHDIRSRRGTPGGLAAPARASRDAHGVQGFAEAGLALNPFGPLVLEPFAGLAWARFTADGATEAEAMMAGGIPGTALRLGGTRQDLGWASLGIRAEARFPLGATALVLAPRAGFAWQHAMGQLSATSRGAFLAGGQGFAVSGAPLARDAALVEAGAELLVTPRLRLGLAYAGVLADRVREHAVRGGLAWTW